MTFRSDTNYVGASDAFPGKLKEFNNNYSSSNSGVLKVIAFFSQVTYKDIFCLEAGFRDQAAHEFLSSSI